MRESHQVGEGIIRDAEIMQVMPIKRSLDVQPVHFWRSYSRVYCILNIALVMQN